MAFQQYENKEDLNVGIEPKSDGTINLIADPRIPMYRPRLALGDPADKRFWQKVYTSQGQPFTQRINSASLNQEFYFQLATENPNLFVNWEDSYMSLDMALSRKYASAGDLYTIDTANAITSTLDSLFLKDHISDSAETSELPGPVLKTSLGGDCGFLWYHGTHTFFNKIDIRHITTNRLVESIRESDILTQASIYALPSSAKEKYLHKFGAELVDFNVPLIYANGTKYIMPGIGALPVKTTTTNSTTLVYIPSTELCQPFLATSLIDMGTIGLPLSRDLVASNKLMTAPTAITANTASDDFVTTSGETTVDILSSRTRASLKKLPEYFDQMHDLLPAEISVYSADNTTVPTVFSRKQVIIPSNYLRNGQLLYLKAEPLEMRFTLNNIQRVLTVIHPATIASASTGGIQGHISNYKEASDLDYTIHLKEICMNVCFEEMPAEIINKLNVRWTDPTIGIIKDFTKCTTITLNNITANSGTRQVLQVIQNDIHHLKQILIVFRNNTNNDNITLDRYQFTDGSRWGESSKIGGVSCGPPTYFKSVQFQIGVDYYPALPIEFELNHRDEILNYTNEVLFVGDNSFVDNMLTTAAYQGQYNCMVPTNVSSTRATNSYLGFFGGSATKFMIGYDFSRHHHSLRSGVSLEARPLNITIEMNNAPTFDIIPTVFLFHEATFTITPTSSTLLT